MTLGQVFFALFLSLFSIPGFIILRGSIRSARQSLLAAHWPTTRGILAKVEIVHQMHGEETRKALKIEYIYRIAGQEYRGDRLAYGFEGNSDERDLRPIVEKLRGSGFVDVRYDPASPKHSTLSCGLHKSLQTMFAFAAVWIVCAGGFATAFILTRLHDAKLVESVIVP